MNPDNNTWFSQDEWEAGHHVALQELARTLTRLRAATDKPEAIAALDAVAVTHGITTKTVTTVEYVA